MDFTLVQAPVFTPNACLICASGTDRDGFVDCGVDLSHRGALTSRVYVCGACVLQMGARCGMASRDDVEKLNGDIRARDEALDAALVELEHERMNKTVDLRQLGLKSNGSVVEVDPLRCPEIGCTNAKTTSAKRCKPCANRVPSEKAAA